jgi:hypothetical protein
MSGPNARTVVWSDGRNTNPMTLPAAGAAVIATPGTPEGVSSLIELNVTLRLHEGEQKFLLYLKGAWGKLRFPTGSVKRGKVWQSWSPVKGAGTHGCSRYSGKGQSFTKFHFNKRDAKDFQGLGKEGLYRFL